MYYYRPGLHRYWCQGYRRTFHDLTHTVGSDQALVGARALGRLALVSVVFVAFVASDCESAGRPRLRNFCYERQR